MFRRRRSFAGRFRDVGPLFALAVLGLGGVFLGMNLLVTAAPVVTDQGTPPAPSAGASLLGSPSLLPLAAGSSAPAPAVASLPDYGPTFVRSEVSAADPNGVWNVYLQYPLFVPGTTPWAEQMDSELQATEEAKAERFESGPAAIQQAPGKVNHLTGGFHTELLSPQLASFVMDWQDDTDPGQTAQGVDTITFDLSTGQAIGFDDIFPDDQAALTLLSGVARTQLYDEPSFDWNQTVVDDGTAPRMDNFGNWTITPAGFKVYFGQYQVDSTGNIVSIVVAWSDLKRVLTNQGPVAALAGIGS